MERASWSTLLGVKEETARSPMSMVAWYLAGNLVDRLCEALDVASRDAGHRYATILGGVDRVLAPD